MRRQTAQGWGGGGLFFFVDSSSLFRGGSVFSCFFSFGWLGSGMDLAASSLVAYCFPLSFLFLLMSLHGVDKMRQEDMIPIALFSHPCLLLSGRGMVVVAVLERVGWSGREIVTERAADETYTLTRLYPPIYAETSKPVSFYCIARRGLFVWRFPLLLHLRVYIYITMSREQQQSSRYT